MFPDWAKIGAKVVCISNNPTWKKPVDRFPLYYPKIGSNYTIRDIGYLHPDFPDLVTVYLEEIHNSELLEATGWENPFALHRFRPLITLEEDMKMFNTIIKDIKIKEDV